MDPDSWPAIWPVVQLLVSLVILFFAMIFTGVQIENSSQKEINESGIGMSTDTVAALIFSLPFLAWSVISDVKIATMISALFFAQPEMRPGAVAAISAVMLLVLGIAEIMVFILLPLCWGRARSDQYDARMRPMRALVSLFRPVARLVTLPARHLIQSRGVASEIGTVTEEDMMEMVGSVESGSFIDENQKEMISNIFELDDVTAADIMTHRTEIEAVPVTATTDEIINTAVEFGYSRIPVFEGSLDNIIGIAYVKDLLPYVGKGIKGIDLTKLWRPTLFVPESRRARELLFDFKQRKIQLAVVVDEYGGTAGIVTMEDILESIVGDIEDEYDEEERYIVEEPDGTFLCDGYAEVESVFEALGLDEAYDDVESDTIGGLLTDLLARIPRKGEQPTAVFGGAELTALDADERRITSVRVRKLAED